MRNPGRIDPFLERLAEVWKRVPDWRFGQLIMNLTRTEEGFEDPWNWEEIEWEKKFSDFKEPEELTDDEILARAHEVLRMMNLDPGGRDSFE